MFSQLQAMSSIRQTGTAHAFPEHIYTADPRETS